MQSLQLRIWVVVKQDSMNAGSMSPPQLQIYMSISALSATLSPKAPSSTISSLVWMPTSLSHWWIILAAMMSFG